MNAPAPITITPVRVADLLAVSERMPVYVHVIDHPDAHVLVATGMASGRRRWRRGGLARRAGRAVRRGQLRVRALDPELVWLAHEHEPWRPRTV